MKSPLVSVITPTYNRAGLLAETLESVLAQCFGDFEYLIVDDGSSDDTLAMLANVADARVRVICNETNCGEVISINRGWAEARGRYVAILSSDDPVQPMWLGEMVGALERNPDAVAAYPDWNIIDLHGELKQVVRTPDFRRAELASRFVMGAGPGALIRKSAGDCLPQTRRERFRYCADLDMWLHLSLLGPLVRVPKVLACWREHPDSLTVAERSLRRAEELHVLAQEFFGQPDLPADLVAVASGGLASACDQAAWVLAESDPPAAEHYLALSRSYRNTQASARSV